MDNGNVKLIKRSESIRGKNVETIKRTPGSILQVIDSSIQSDPPLLESKLREGTSLMDIKRHKTATNVDANSDWIRRALDPEIEKRREEYLDVQVTHQQQQDQAMASSVF